ncbi:MULTISPECIES: Si-specific NAD(P)(+) transhydrogenase [unclassified Oleiphilus]|jgi:NAD(P) transhydrogenase|nr:MULTISPECIES: Si-specific NAD(P)(+) transhydrogenase [unclassified Oleiphilus]KZY73793.1 NAD(P)(+) transhydrogenase [Oleiphilus sp. HI0068]KZY80314.1 NAD(P)(+) transhydrogenase [Oleiphilus sp. HI0069]KZY97344.1 NAD(P)(+) transhydrogenase [Oleiphilus sp. HI0072]KZZ11925.1 NAD(P)(+) transhydrogenase [Oleiphilus sp. HI0078]KZZ38679.1 NAD(P)(+) transhydrogenase [Oleiphilus sp. HI0085]
MRQVDVVIIGSGPAGQKAAVQAAKGGKSVALIERDQWLGGACVHRGTIPSKTLRENALRVKKMRENAALCQFELAEDTEMSTLIDRLNRVLKAHDGFMVNQIERNNIERIHGRAKFVSPNVIEVTKVRGEAEQIEASSFVIASGSIPRKPDNIPVDHENIFDSDSILTMLYLPKSLTVLGGGVIASEYASIFQALGVKVTMIDRYPLPLGFMDGDLTSKFVDSFQEMGGTWLGEKNVETVEWDGLSEVITRCDDGTIVRSAKLLCAAGRVANVKDLQIANAGLELNEFGNISVDDMLQTQVPHIYAAGDVIGPPSLASASMEQGRRASCNALGIEVGPMSKMIPSGIYGIPELSAVGMTEQQAKKEHGDGIVIGKANFEEISRGQINGIRDGMLKIICDPQGEKILGVQIVGEGATELIHIGQMAMLSNADVDIFVESIFNFPTLAEAYRVAALAVIGKRSQHSDKY